MRDSEARPVAFLHGFSGRPDDYPLHDLQTALGSTTDALRLCGAELHPDGGRAWWNGSDGEEPHPAEVEAIIDTIDAQLASARTDATPMLLAGFSQGAAAALLYALLRRPDHCEIAAVVAVAGFLPIGPSHPGITDPTTRDTRILLLHPTDDEVVDIFLGQRASRLLTTAGFDVTFDEIAGGHEWSNSVVGPVTEFILR